MDPVAVNPVAVNPVDVDVVRRAFAVQVGVPIGLFLDLGLWLAIEDR